MAITVSDILTYPSLKQATCLTGSKGLEKEVTGAIVMEAVDIEEWGRPGLLLLTSYFALESVTPAKMEAFFRHAKKVGIAGFIFKLDRLVSEIPPFFIHYCQKYEIPLIQINKQTRYEKIITEILESIINRNAYLLQNYYDIHQHFASLMLRQPGISQILDNLKNLIQMPVTLVEKVEGHIWGTDEAYHHLTVVKKEKLNSQQYMSLPYQQYTITYKEQEFAGEYCALAVSIPNLGYEEYELIVHLLDHTPKDIDFVAIENAAVALQTELIKQYALRQNNQSRFNEMASDLLHGRFSNQEHIRETIQDLHLNPDKHYRVILFNFENQDKEASSFLPNRFADALINHSKIEFPHLLYVSRIERVILIAPTDSISLDEAKRKVHTILDKIQSNALYSSFHVYTSVSNEVNVYQLQEGYRQAFDTQKIIHMIGEPNVVATYQDMGVYQIFVETGNLKSLERFIPDTIWKLKATNLELLETLRVFIDTNQNYSDAAQILFIHPKTVRYRVDRLKENYQIDFQNPEEILHYSIAMRLLKLLPKEQEQT